MEAPFPEMLLILFISLTEHGCASFDRSNLKIKIVIDKNICVRKHLESVSKIHLGTNTTISDKNVLLLTSVILIAAKHHLT